MTSQDKVRYNAAWRLRNPDKAKAQRKRYVQKKVASGKNAQYMRGYYAKRRSLGLCGRCGQPSDRPDRIYCSTCKNKMEPQRVSHNLKQYGLTRESFAQILADQGGLCALCEHPLDGSRGPACVDHCHETKTVRGILDRMCNQAIGLLGDDIAGLELALKYLRRPECRSKPSVP